MWIVAKIKIKEIKIFKLKLIEKYGDEISFYSPKILLSQQFLKKIKKYERFILENYIFCHHKKFNKTSSVNEIQFTKGLQYFLSGHTQNQKEIEKFISYCKSFENKDGYLMPLFFKKALRKKGQFTSGPFSNMMFEIIEKQKNKLKVLVGSIVTTISDNKNYLYRSV